MNGHALSHAFEKPRNNQEIVLTAIKQKYTAIQYASEELMLNKKFNLIVIKIEP